MSYAYQPLMSFWFHLKFVVLGLKIVQALCFHSGWSWPEMLATVGKWEILRSHSSFLIRAVARIWCVLLEKICHLLELRFNLPSSLFVTLECSMLIFFCFYHFIIFFFKVKTPIVSWFKMFCVLQTKLPVEFWWGISLIYILSFSSASEK